MKSNLMVSFRSVFFTLFMAAVANPVWAAGYTLPKATGAFSKLGQWMQEYIDFMTGTAAVAVVLGSLILFVCAWMMAPKSGAVGGILRVVAGGIVLLNVSTWMGSFG